MTTGLKWLFTLHWLLNRLHNHIIHTCGFQSAQIKFRIEPASELYGQPSKWMLLLGWISGLVEIVNRCTFDNRFCQNVAHFLVMLYACRGLITLIHPLTTKGLTWCLDPPCSCSGSAHMGVSYYINEKNSKDVMHTYHNWTNLAISALRAVADLGVIASADSCSVPSFLQTETQTKN